MAQPRVLILRAPGTNCDLETAYAFELAGGIAERWHVRRLLEQPNAASRFQIVCLPGGFSYGDDIAAGRILGSQIRHHLTGALADFREAGKLILGICNGFQILLKSGLLLPPDERGELATLAFNAGGRFVDRWVNLAVCGGNAPFFAGIERMELPIAHAEGQFVARDRATLDRLEAAGQLLLRYCGAGGERPAPPGANPNGAQADVAGICDATGRVCGLMPHPERHVERTQHPRWTRETRSGQGDGLAVFVNAVRYFR